MANFSKAIGMIISVDGFYLKIHKNKEKKKTYKCLQTANEMK